MSLARVVLAIVQALLNQRACTPPNPTPAKGRYHTDELYILQIAPFIFKCHYIITSACAIFESLYYLKTVIQYPSPVLHATSFLCLSSRPNIHTTLPFIIGVIAVVLGAYIRLHCFRALGPMFTFDLTVHPEHKLVTSHFYAYVRHPSYSGSMLLVIGLAFSHLTRGSWLTECGPLHAVPSLAPVLWALWWAWTFWVGLSRAAAEDKQMQILFKSEWEEYAANVPWWFFPGLI